MVLEGRGEAKRPEISCGESVSLDQALAVEPAGTTGKGSSKFTDMLTSRRDFHLPEMCKISPCLACSGLLGPFFQSHTGRMSYVRPQVQPPLRKADMRATLVAKHEKVNGHQFRMIQGRILGLNIFTNTSRIIMWPFLFSYGVSVSIL